MSVGIVQIPKNIVPLLYKHHELTKMNRYYLAINLLHELQISHSEPVDISTFPCFGSDSNVSTILQSILITYSKYRKPRD